MVAIKFIQFILLMWNLQRITPTQRNFLTMYHQAKFKMLRLRKNYIQHCQAIRILNKEILSLQSGINHLKNQVQKCKYQVPVHKKLLLMI